MRSFCGRRFWLAALVTSAGSVACASRPVPSTWIQPCDRSARWVGNTPAPRVVRVWLEVPSGAGSGWVPERDLRLGRALDAWNHLHLPVRLVPATTWSSAGIVATVIPRLPRDTLTPVNAHRAGVTHLTIGEHDAIIRARVFVAEATPGGRPYSVGDQMATLQHELGHALGLPHAPDARALMAETPFVDTPTGVDAALASAWYAPGRGCTTPVITAEGRAIPASPR